MTTPNFRTRFWIETGKKLPSVESALNIICGVLVIGGVYAAFTEQWLWAYFLVLLAILTAL